MLEVADIAIAGLRTVGDALGEPLQRGRDALDAHERVGVVGPRGGELAQRARGLLHALGRVAEHVDRPGREVRRADPLGQHADARAALGQPRRGREPGAAGADDDGVEVQLASS